jgi:hypothetical protein
LIDDLDRLKKPVIQKQTQASILKGLRAAAKPLRKDARNFVGSRLKKRTGETARRIKVGARKRKGGALLELKGSGALNIWESPKGRKAFKVPNKKKSAIVRLGARLLRVTLKDPIKIPASGPRPVLQPALSKNETNIKKLVSTEMVRAIENLMPDKIQVYKAGEK